MTLTARNFATLSTQQPGSLPEYQVDPYHLLEDDLKDVYTYIKQVGFANLLLIYAHFLIHLHYLQIYLKKKYVKCVNFICYYYY